MVVLLVLLLFYVKQTGTLPKLKVNNYPIETHRRDRVRQPSNMTFGFG